jgi:hypothetical protein
MEHYKLQDADVPGLHIIGADAWGLSLLRSVGNIPVPDERGWSALNAEIERIEPDIIVLDPLMSLMGGVDGNNNSAAAIFMGKLVKLAADRHIAVVIAHHAAKGRDPNSADSAMGAASFVNFARIVLTIEPLAEKDAGRIGVLPWKAHSIFRVLGVKRNFSAADPSDRWFRQVSVELNNARPPVYPYGDEIAVVEPFQPGASGAVYVPAVISDALKALDAANPPLSPSKRATTRYAAGTIANAIAHHRGGQVSESEAAAVLEYLRRSGLVAVQKVNIARAGSRTDERDGLVVTPQGKAAMQEPDPAGAATAPPQPPQSSRGNNAGLQDGGGPKGPRNVPGGCGGNAGGENAGSDGSRVDSESSKTPSQAPGLVFPTQGTQPPAKSSDTPAVITATTVSIPSAGSAAPTSSSRTPRCSVTDAAVASQPAPSPAPSHPETTATDAGDDLDIPAVLRRGPDLQSE